MKRVIFVSLAILFMMNMAACKPSTPNSKKTIVVTYSVLGSVVKELVGDAAIVTIPMPNGLDPHEWEPSAKDIEAINKANLVIENGLGLEGGMEKTLDTARKKGGKFFTASEYITIRHVGPGEGIPTGDPDQAIGAEDPHLWLDPLAMKSIVAALSDELKRDFGMDVTARAADLGNRLDSLNTEVQGIVTQIPPDDRKLVTGHESLGYFAQRYTFKLVGVIIPSLTTQAGVSAADLATLKKSIQDNQVMAIFTELGTSPAVAKTIGDETDVQVIELTTHALPGDGSYFTFMKNLATVIANGLK